MQTGPRHSLHGSPTDMNNASVQVADGLARGQPCEYRLGIRPNRGRPRGNDRRGYRSTLAGNRLHQCRRNLQRQLHGQPTDLADLTVQISDGPIGLANLANIGSGYDLAEAAPAATISGANKGTLTGNRLRQPRRNAQRQLRRQPNRYCKPDRTGRRRCDRGNQYRLRYDPAELAPCSYHRRGQRHANRDCPSTPTEPSTSTSPATPLIPQT